jgi:hypothetical protein
MRRHITTWIVCTGALSLALAFSAVRTEAAGVQAKATDQDARVSVIGCVRRAEPAPGATVGVTAVPEGETEYVLANITLAEEPGHTGTTAPNSELLAQAVKIYRLDDSAKAVIAPHVGDRVAITGVIVTISSSPRGTTGTTAPAAGSSVAPTLRVESLRKISSSSTVCSQ